MNQQTTTNNWLYSLVGATLICACVIALAISKGNASPLIPLELLFGDEKYASPTISPDGKQIAYLAPHNGIMNIWVRSADDASDAHVVTNDMGRGIHTYWWGYDNATLFYLQNKDGNENWNVYRVTCATGETINLTPFPDVQVKLVHYSKKFPEMMLISMNKEDKRLRDVYLLEVTTGALTMVAKNPGNNVGWKADDDLQVRISWIMNDDGSATMFHRLCNTQLWHEFIHFPVEVVSQSCACVGFDTHTDAVYCVDASDNDKARLVKVLTKTKEKDVLAVDEQYDVAPELILHPETNQPILSAIQRAEREIIVLDNAYTEDIAFLQKHKPHTTFNVVSYDRAFDKWIVQFSSSNLPSEYYLYNRATKQLAFLFTTQPELRNYTLAKTEAISFAARDGLTIHGYITYPTTITAKKKLPVVIWPHGGPWLRDRMGHCDPIVQLLANRGYACLQLNYRGSIGYGNAFVKAGYKEFGRAMQHDLTDGIEWLINQGIADAQRVAILGGSYGGYAALAGAAFTPDLYCCAVDLCGMSNLITFVKSIPAYWKPLIAKLNVEMGNLDTDRAMLEERSPLFSADKIKIPILIGQGANDPRVTQAESDQMVAALKQRGIPCEYLLFENEGHGLARPANRVKFYRTMEQFFARYLGGRCESCTDADKK